MIEAKVIEDSISQAGIRLTTLQLRYHRFFHSEVMTHRVFTRNASSSRAIPVKKMLAQVWNDPATPIHWGANQPGMQANTQLKGFRLWVAKTVWKLSAKVMCGFVWAGMQAGMHKQTANRLLEPWQYISVILTSTDWKNFFELRNHPDAQPEIRELAYQMQKAMDGSTPILRQCASGEARNWHLPYVTANERALYSRNPKFLAKLSAARCARVSYLTHDGRTPSHKADESLFDRLVGSEPLHASPIEHQGHPMRARDGSRSRNFRGWKQFRDIFEGVRIE